MDKPGPSPERAKPKFNTDLYPTPEDWDALQGGRPRVFRDPRHPKKPWEVVHVYEQHGDHNKRFQSGAIVETPVPEGGFPSPLPKSRPTEDGLRDFVVPGFMDRNVHGDLCEDRSREVGGGDYRRIKNQVKYEKYIEQKRSEGWQEVRFTVTQEGFKLQALPEINPPLPLDQSAA